MEVWEDKWRMGWKGEYAKLGSQYDGSCTKQTRRYKLCFFFFFFNIFACRTLTNTQKSAHTHGDTLNLGEFKTRRRPFGWFAPWPWGKVISHHLSARTLSRVHRLQNWSIPSVNFENGKRGENYEETHPMPNANTVTNKHTRPFMCSLVQLKI